MTVRIALLMLLALLVAAPAPAAAQTWVSAGEGKKGWLGVETQDVTGRLRDRKDLAVDAGAYVNNVVEDSPAEAAGIQEGDVITKVDGKQIDDADDLVAAIRKIKPETQAKIEVDRKGEKKTLTATIERSRTPEAFTFHFEGDRDHKLVIPRVPRMPRMPELRRQMRVFVDDRTDGLEVHELTRQLAEYFEVPSGRGLLVASVKKGSSAEKAGFKAGDVIVKIDGETVRDLDDFYDVTRGARGGKDVPCEVVRKGKAQSFNWKLEREDDDDEEEDDYSFMSCPQPPSGHCEAPRAAGLATVKMRLERFQERFVERVSWLKDMLSLRLAALWRPIEQQFS